MPKSAPEKLRRFYDQFEGQDHVLIVINADPDAIASAMAVSRLLWRRVLSVTISNVNTINRPDNLTMLRLLKVAMIPFNEIDPVQFTKFAIVDSQPDHNESMEQLEPAVIIDHHKDSKPQAPFVDIRPHYGATATILTEYLRAARIKPSVKLATGLFQAIKTDTNSFKGQTVIEDVRAFQYVFRFANMHLVRRIEKADLRISFLKYFKTALNHMRLRKGRVYVHLGPVVNPDVCVSPAPVIKSWLLSSETTVFAKMPARWPKKASVNSARQAVTATWPVLKQRYLIYRSTSITMTIKNFYDG
jgi:nanoRNase/pAp phosphatase (c-di-AMP/oligoRNAs hydrolase)